MAGQQAVSDVKKMGEEATIELGLKPQAQGADDSQKNDQAKEEEIKKMKIAANQERAAGYQKIQEEIRQIEIKRGREIPKEIFGKPGFDEGKAVKQLETGKAEEDKNKLPPLPVQRETKKTEAFRGTSG